MTQTPTIDKEIRGHRIVFRAWTYGEKQDALRKSTTFKQVDDMLEPDIDPWTLNDNMLIRCITEWDLKDEATGQPLPITVEAIRNIRPPELVEEMIAFAQTINGVSVTLKKK